MRYDLVLLDFDGTFTDVEKEAGPFFEAYLADVRELLGPGFESEWEQAAATMSADPANHGWLHEGRIVAPGNADPYLRATKATRAPTCSSAFTTTTTRRRTPSSVPTPRPSSRLSSRAECRPSWSPTPPPTTSNERSTS